MAKSIYNAFDHMEFCVLSYKQKNHFSESWLDLEIALIAEFPGSNFLLLTFLMGGKQDFQVANLLLAAVNFEPW